MVPPVVVDQLEALVMVELAFFEKRREGCNWCKVWYILVEKKTYLSDYGMLRGSNSCRAKTRMGYRNVTGYGGGCKEWKDWRMAVSRYLQRETVKWMSLALHNPPF